ncbi:MAG: MoaD/ThiS family protein [Gammaproteobacteria bacterium]|jgi:molybdopterin converting factor subunit 1
MTTKNLTVRYFALFRERAGCDREELAVEADTVGDLFAEVSRRHGLPHLRDAKVAVNDEMSRFDASLRDGDVVLFFPPVSGG